MHMQAVPNAIATNSRTALVRSAEHIGPKEQPDVTLKATFNCLSIALLPLECMNWLQRWHMSLKKIIIIKKTDRTSRQTQAGIGHSAPAHRGEHMQNRISRRQVRRGKIEHSAEAEQPRKD